MIATNHLISLIFIRSHGIILQILWEILGHGKIVSYLLWARTMDGRAEGIEGLKHARSLDHLDRLRSATSSDHLRWCDVLLHILDWVTSTIVAHWKRCPTWQKRGPVAFYATRWRRAPQAPVKWLAQQHMPRAKRSEASLASAKHTTTNPATRSSQE